MLRKITLFRSSIAFFGPTGGILGVTKNIRIKISYQTTIHRWFLSFSLDSRCALRFKCWMLNAKCRFFLYLFRNLLSTKTSFSFSLSVCAVVNIAQWEKKTRKTQPADNLFCRNLWHGRSKEEKKYSTQVRVFVSVSVSVFVNSNIRVFIGIRYCRF